MITREADMLLSLQLKQGRTVETGTSLPCGPLYRADVITWMCAMAGCGKHFHSQPAMKSA